MFLIFNFFLTNFIPLIHNLNASKCIAEIILKVINGCFKYDFINSELVRSDLTSKNLMNFYLKHPLMTFKIISAIHFEAFKLWIKGIKFIKKKFKIKNNLTVEN